MDFDRKWYRTKKNIGFTNDGKDLSDSIIVVGDYLNVLFPDWFLVNNSIQKINPTDDDIYNSIPMRMRNTTLEFVSRVIGAYGSDYKIDPNKCVSGYVIKYGMTYIFQLDELEEIEKPTDYMN